MTDTPQTDDLMALQGAYIHWAEALIRAAGVASSSLVEPIFVRANMTAPAFLETLDKHDAYRIEDTQQMSLLLQESDAPVHAIIYRELGTDFARPELPPEWSVEHVGALSTFAGRPPLAERREVPQKHRTHGVVVGIIDDGIAYLNRRFVDDRGHTRFLALWQQSMAVLGGGAVQMGDILETEDIQDHLNGLALTTEQDRYRQQHRLRLSDQRASELCVRYGDERFPLAQSYAHGTFMADLAAGASGDDHLAHVPLIGVQLPAPVFDDTSGARLATPLLLGLRWMIERCLTAGAERLILNISLGTTAGSKDGKDFLSRKIAAEVARAQTLGLQVNIVMPYGNSYDDRMVARVTVGSDAVPLPKLILPPDDRTASHVELRGPLSDLAVTVRAPDGTVTRAEAMPPNNWLPLRDGSGNEVGRIYHDATFARALVLSFAPTATWSDRGLLAAPGGWQIALQRQGTEAPVIAQIQRDDRIAGSRLHGRQARFDEPEAHGYDPVLRSYSDLSGAITHEGTNSAYAAIGAPYLSRVGAAWLAPDNALKVRPARYSAQGAEWSGRAPDLSHVIERGTWLNGLRARGNSSGKVLRQSGTSLAAALETRRLTLEAIAPLSVATTVSTRPESHPRLGSSTYDIKHS